MLMVPAMCRPPAPHLERTNGTFFWPNLFCNKYPRAGAGRSVARHGVTYHTYLRITAATATKHHYLHPGAFKIVILTLI